MVRAKFICASKVELAYGWEVNLVPVQAGSVENEKFYDATPTGGMSLGLLNTEAADNFTVGKEYFIDISEAIVEPDTVEAIKEN